jgi:glyceraldehyde 3-phosphate dehydrogenase
LKIALNRIEVSHDEKNLIIDGGKIQFNVIRNPEELPCKENNIDVVIENTGLFL